LRRHRHRQRALRRGLQQLEDSGTTHNNDEAHNHVSHGRHIHRTDHNSRA
jgi:hypothetical protein